MPMSTGVWKNLAYSIWEQIVGFGMIVALFGIFKGRLNGQSPFAKKLSASAYAVYVFHTPVLIGISILFLGLNIPQPAKLLVLAPITLIACYLIGYIVKSTPIARDIF